MEPIGAGAGATTTTGDENPLRFESQRLETFAKWSQSAKVGAGKIARAGFYYTGNYTEVTMTKAATDFIL